MTKDHEWASTHGTQKEIDEYLATVARLEPEITPIDLPAAAASISISLRRIADSLERSEKLLEEIASFMKLLDRPQ